jgi:hypothetical protein
MPSIVSEQAFDGAENLIGRLGLDELLAEVRSIVTGFELLIEEKRDGNSAGAVRAMIDGRFEAAEGGVQKKTGGVDWVKKQAVNGRPRFICMGVEIQVSGRSDLVAVDLLHLRTQLCKARSTWPYLSFRATDLAASLPTGSQLFHKPRGISERAITKRCLSY